MLIRNPSSRTDSNDTATVIALGVLAATLADICHETLGHGLGCFSAGGHITLLTSTWFHCSKWSALADAGGPLGNLVAGFLALAILNYTRPTPAVRLLLLLLGALSLFWFTAQLTFESLTHRQDDWYWALQMFGSWRPVGAVVGVGGYVLVGESISALSRKQHGPNAHAIRLGYAAAAASAVIAGLLFRPEPFRSALEGFLMFGIAPLGLLSVARQARQDVGKEIGTGSVPNSWIWICVGVVIFGLFLFIQARGLGMAPFRATASMAALDVPSTPTVAPAHNTAVAPGITLIPGTFPEGQQPDGNTVMFTAPDGLIVMDTGRHAEHTQQILDFATQTKRPIKAIINSHWHLDHIGGNPRIRDAYSDVRIYASGALEAAKQGFLADYRRDLEGALQQEPNGAQAPGWRNELAIIAAAPLADERIDASGPYLIAGRRLFSLVRLRR